VNACDNGANRSATSWNPPPHRRTPDERGTATDAEIQEIADTLLADARAGTAVRDGAAR
jgi:hypothetical protein